MYTPLTAEGVPTRTFPKSSRVLGRKQHFRTAHGGKEGELRRISDQRMTEKLGRYGSQRLSSTPFVPTLSRACTSACVLNLRLPCNQHGVSPTARVKLSFMKPSLAAVNRIEIVLRPEILFTPAGDPLTRTGSPFDYAIVLPFAVRDTGLGSSVVPESMVKALGAME